MKKFALLFSILCLNSTHVMAQSYPSIEGQWLDCSNNVMGSGAVSGLIFRDDAIVIWVVGVPTVESSSDNCIILLDTLFPVMTLAYKFNENGILNLYNSESEDPVGSCQLSGEAMRCDFNVGYIQTFKKMSD